MPTLAYQLAKSEALSIANECVAGDPVEKPGHLVAERRRLSLYLRTLV